LKRRDALLIEKAIEDGWSKVSKAEPVKIPIELEAGETAAISLAKKLGRQEVLIDEVSARTAARLLGLEPRGTIFVLLKTMEEGGMNMDEFLETLNELVKHGFRLREEVYLEAIRKAREIEGAKS
jgi:predicted nucleic acid-binding protein